MNLSVLLSEYVAIAAVRANTARLYRIALSNFEKSLGRAAATDDLNDAALARFAGQRIADGIQAATVSNEQKKLLAVWRFAAKLRYVEKWPMLKPLKIPERIPLAWTQDELTILFKAAELTGPVGRVPGYLWWGALFGVLWDSGERINAVLQTKWSYVDLNMRTLYCPAENRKGGQADRLYSLAPDTCATITKLPRDNPPFHFPFHVSTLYGRMTILLKRSGLPTDRRSKFHRIRRSTASHYEAAGGNATEFLGHSSRRITQQSYLDPRICKPQSPVDLLFRPGQAAG